jgi:putative component of toxin-antitoxin plasmid stabilization module
MNCDSDLGQDIGFTIQSRRNIIVLLLICGDKASQKKDIKSASEILEEI